MFNFAALKQYIEDNGYKQKFVAQKANLSEATFGAILSGRIKCTVDNYVSICRALSVPFDKFIGDEHACAV